MEAIDLANNAWMLAATCLVLFMTPGLAFFYGGLDESKNVSNMMNMCIYCLGIVPILWVCFVYSLTAAGFGGGDGADGGFIGDASFFFLNQKTHPGDLLSVAFGATFAILTPALIAGAVAGRMKFAAWAWFVPLWLIFVYAPVTHWVFGPGGWLLELPVHDFAGGTSVHLNAAAAALVLSKVLGPRRGWPSSQKPPHNLPLVLLGTGILFFGWLGFNAGAGDVATVAPVALINTLLAASGGLLGWMLVERMSGVRTNIVGMCSGLVAGLVAITPACAFVGPLASIIIGMIAALLCYLALGLKKRFNFDDSFDVVGIHGVGGVVGAVLIGFFADNSITDGDFLEGVFFTDTAELLWNQLIAVGATIGWSVAVTFVIAVVLKKTVGLRVSDEAQIVGMDQSEHSSNSYLL